MFWDKLAILSEPRALMLLLPIVFMLHEFEELIWMRPWLRRQGPGFLASVPNRLRPTIEQLLAISAERFTAIVAFEFVAISAASLWAYCGGPYGRQIWLGGVWLFAVHLLMHFRQAALVGRVLPPLISSLWVMPFCGFVLWRFHGVEGESFGYLLLASILGWLFLSFIAFRFIGGVRR